MPKRSFCSVASVLCSNVASGEQARQVKTCQSSSFGVGSSAWTRPSVAANREVGTVLWMPFDGWAVPQFSGVLLSPRALRRLSL